MVGTLMTLFVYDYYNERLVFAVALGFPGFLNILTPFFAKQGGYYVTSILRFFTGTLSNIFTFLQLIHLTKTICDKVSIPRSSPQ